MDTRDLLLDRALELFAARGYDAVGVQEIVAAAKVTKPTLYHHFGNKAGLFAALLEREGRPLLERLVEVTRYDNDLTGLLSRVTHFYLTFAQTRPQVYRLLASSALAPPESEAFRIARPYGERQHLLLEALFEAAGHDHGNMRGRARRYASSFLGLLDGTSRMLLTGDLLLDDRLVVDLVQQFSYGIYS